MPCLRCSALTWSRRCEVRATASANRHTPHRPEAQIMTRGLLRLGAVAAALLLCAAGGLLVGWVTRLPLAGLLSSAALGLGAMLLSDVLKGSRLLAWLRADAQGQAPQE